MRGLVLDAGPAQRLSGRRSEAPGFGASDESAEDWSQADSQSSWGLHQPLIAFIEARRSDSLLTAKSGRLRPTAIWLIGRPDPIHLQRGKRLRYATGLPRACVRTNWMSAAVISPFFVQRHTVGEAYGALLRSR